MRTRGYYFSRPSFGEIYVEVPSVARGRFWCDAMDDEDGFTVWFGRLAIRYDASRGPGSGTRQDRPAEAPKRLHLQPVE